MRATKWKIAVVAAALALPLAACGDDDADKGVADVDTEVSFDEGTTMAELNEAGEITIGTKFDQPLFGLKGPDGDPEGFDVEIGKLVAEALDVDPAGVQTNIVVAARPDAAAYVARARAAGVLLSVVGPDTVRAVTHLGVTRADVERAAAVLAAL